MSCNYNHAFERIVKRPPESREVELVDGVTGLLVWTPEPGLRTMRCFLISDAFDPPIRSEPISGDKLPDDEDKIRRVHMLSVEDVLQAKARATMSRP